MKFLSRLAVTIVVLLTNDAHPSAGARILAIIGAPAYSHQVTYRTLWVALSRRGHELVLVTTNPMRDANLTNLKEIDLGVSYEAISNFDPIHKRHRFTWMDLMEMELWDATYAMSRNIYEHPEVREMYAPDSGVKFDAVIVEILSTPACYALAQRFDAPLIGAASLGIYNYNYYYLGGPVLPSHPSTWEMAPDVGFDLPFWKRVRNYLVMWNFVWKASTVFMAGQQTVAEKYLGEGTVDIWELERNMSIVLVYEQEALSYARPTVPNIVLFGGGHVSSERPPLSESLEDFISDAPNGFIYVSLGTITKGKYLPREVRQAFVDVFSKLPCRVLWKYEKDLPDKPDNVFVSSWFPQSSVLAHPKMRLFVYQGGLQSTNEAVYNAVPLVGIPIIADQDYTVEKMVSLGVARRVEIIGLTRESLDEAVRDVLTDHRYKERMIRLRDLAMDRPYDPVANAVWWIEHAIRHKGADHLRCSIRREPWYRRSDVDIVAFLSIVIFLGSILALIAIYRFFTLFSLFVARHRTVFAVGQGKKTD